MTIKLIIIAIIVIQAIAGVIAQKRAADKKKREREEAIRRGLPVEDQDEDDEEFEPEREKRESAGLGDIFDVFKDEGAKRPEPPPPLGSPGSERPSTQATTAPEAPRGTSIRLPNGIVIELPLPVPAPAEPPPAPRREVPAPASEPREPRRVGDAPARQSTIRKGKVRQQSERQKELARRAALRQASWGARKKRTSSRESAINRPKGPSAAASKDTKAEAVAPTNPTAVAVRKAFEDPRRMRTAFVLAEILRPPPGGG